MGLKKIDFDFDDRDIICASPVTVEVTPARPVVSPMYFG